MQEADEGGRHDVPVLAAELQGRLDAVVHHQSQVLVDRVGTVVGELERRQEPPPPQRSERFLQGRGAARQLVVFGGRTAELTFVPGHTRKVKRRHGIIFR